MIRILLAALALTLPLSAQEPIPVLTDGPISIEWAPAASEAADGIVTYELMKLWMPWMPADVVVPSPTYRWRIPPEHIWVDTFEIGVKGCDRWHACSGVTWTTFRVVAATPGTPTLPQNLKIGPPPGLLVRPGGQR